LATDTAGLEVAAAAQRKEWIEARMSEFAADPAMRDRALATILCDFMLMSESFQTLAGAVQKEGLGGLLKAAGGALMKGKNGKA
jgi:hypothetical protein